MIGMEDIIQRHDIKKALQNTKKEVSKIFSEDNADYNGYDIGSKTYRSRKTKAALRRNMKLALAKQQFRDTDPCNHQGTEWYTFADENCYNELDEVVVTANLKAKEESAFSKYVNNIDWWDGSIKDPWPDAKWDWFEDNVNGNPVWGTGGGTMELGNRRGKNSVIGKPYYMDEFIIPGGGGGNMKFWAHLDNWAKYGLKGVQTIAGGIEHNNNLKSVFFDDNTSIIPNNNQETVRDTMTVRMEEYYPYFRRMDGITTQLINRRRYDSIIDKSDYEKVLRSMLLKNQKILEKKRKEFDDKYKEEK